MTENRRQFLITGAVLSALSQNRLLGANERIRGGIIGAGGRRRELMNALARHSHEISMSVLRDHSLTVAARYTFLSRDRNGVLGTVIS